MSKVVTPQEFLFSIAGMKILEAEIALVKYLQQIRVEALDKAFEKMEWYNTEHGGYVGEKGVFEGYIDKQRELL